MVLRKSKLFTVLSVPIMTPGILRFVRSYVHLTLTGNDSVVVESLGFQVRFEGFTSRLYLFELCNLWSVIYPICASVSPSINWG